MFVYWNQARYVVNPNDRLSNHSPGLAVVSFFFPSLFQILPGVKVVIANPETRGMCADSHLGEVCYHIVRLVCISPRDGPDCTLPSTEDRYAQATHT